MKLSTKETRTGCASNWRFSRLRWSVRPGRSRVIGSRYSADIGQMKTTISNRRQAKKDNKKPAQEKTQAPPNIKDLLLNDPKFDLVLPKRTRWRRRPPIIFDR